MTWITEKRITIRRVIITCFVISFLSESSESNLMQLQSDFLTILIEDLHVKHFVMLNNFANETLSEDFLPIIKILSKNKIFSTHLSIDKFNSTFSENFIQKRMYSKTMVLINFQDFSNIFLRTHFQNHDVGVGFVPKITWIIFENLEKIIQKLLDLHSYIPYNCEFLIAVKLNDSTIEIKELYVENIAPGSYIMMGSFGIWTKTGSLETRMKDLYRKRFHLSGSPIVSLVLENSCLDEILDSTWKKPIRKTGGCAYAQIIDEITLKMNFSAYFIESKPLSPDSLNSISELIDVIAMPVGLSHSDNPIWIPLGPIFKMSYSFKIRYDDSMEGGKFSTYLRPLSFNVWLFIIMWFLLFTICHLCIDYSIHQITANFRIADNFFRALYPFLNQGLSEKMESTSLRIVTYMTSLLALVIVPSYCGAITSLLLTETIKLPFEDVAGLVKDGTYKIAFTQYDTTLSGFFEETKDYAIRMANDKYLLDFQQRPLGEFGDIFELICKKPKIAFIDVNDDLLFILNEFLLLGKRKCRILKIRTPLLNKWTTVLLRTQSPYRTIFSRMLKTFRSAGILKKMETLSHPKILNEEKNLEDSLNGIEIGNVIDLFKIIGALHLFSIMILFIEILTARKKIYAKKCLNVI